MDFSGRHIVFKTFAAAFMLMSWACQQSDLELEPQYSELSLCATLSDGTDAPASRGNVSQQGNATNRCVIELYDAVQDTLCSRYVVPVVDRRASLSVNVNHGLTYNILFWADSAATGMQDLYYDTSLGLHEVTVNADNIGNDDARDAFSGAINQISTADVPQDLSIILTRPFAQVNLMATDIESLLDNEFGSGLKPVKVRLSYVAADRFNVENAEIGGSRSFEFEKAVYDSDYVISTSNLIPGVTWSDTVTVTGQTLAMDYLLAPASQNEIVELEMTVTDASGHTATRNFSNIPFKRNCRTNIIGSLMTCSGSFMVSVNPIFFGDLYY